MKSNVTAANGLGSGNKKEKKGLFLQLKQVGPTDNNVK